MAIIKTIVWGRVQRPWGFEVRVDFYSDDGTIHNDEMTFDKEPSPEELSAKVAERQSFLEARLALPPEAVVDPVTEAVGKVRVEYEVKIASLEVKNLALTTALSALKATPKVVL